MKTTCTSYFVDLTLLKQGVPVEALEKTQEIELDHTYEAILSTHETGAKRNKQEARKWMRAICNAHKAPPKEE
jgi:hypothetical protein